MTIPAGEDDRASREAARWLVALEERPDDPDLRARFAAWRDAHPANAAAWADTADVYALMAHTRPAHAARWQRSRPVARRRVVTGIAGAALAASLALVFVPQAALYLQADHTTGSAEVERVELNDGSTVHLAPETAVSVTYGSDGRRVDLLRGQALLTVEADPERPFHVVAGAVETAVIGTVFDVRLQGVGAAVAVGSGRVRVENAAAPSPVREDLAAGEWVRVAADGAVVRGTKPADEVGSWLEGRIVARDEPLAGVVETLRRYHDGLIVVTDPALGERRVTGVYNLSDPAAALQALARAHGATVRRYSPWLLVVSPD